MDLKPMSPFRSWVRNLWTENCAEHDAFNEPEYSLSDYFQKHKWYLKVRYKQEQRNKNGNS